jgi:acetyl-CoA synthetase
MKRPAGTSSDIESVLREQRSFVPPREFAARARLKERELSALHRRAQADYVEFWAALARAHLRWHRPFTRTLDDSEAPNYRWFTRRRAQCLVELPRRAVASPPEKSAIIFEGEPGDVRTLTYRELHAQVCRFANALKGLGYKRGDRVVIYMPMVPEAIVAMHACARIGAIHSVVFGGFSAVSLRDRIEDAGATLVVTADGGWRGGQAVALKAAVDQALSKAARPSAAWWCCGARARASHAGQRDHWWHDLIENARRSASRNGSAPSTRCLCSIPRAPPASPRAFSIPAAGICSMRSSVRVGVRSAR